ncbi:MULTISPECIES: hypothetical protein [Thioclava]|uniref:hypothetical protein n=1 Tax=Thioclava TaxID=285107 RepID=UPI000C6787FB|nr:MULTISPECIES: hypothetical protein [Thioclava]MAQ36235.1 hypothetical protein [Thioclava sp.]|tara:strand:+ start:556 stop:768 length:213 start_codon:yes stop_codon:yes gene_type:complete
MPKRLRLTRRFPVAMTNDAYRRLNRFAQEAEITPDEALTFLFEHFSSVTHEENLNHRLRLFKAELGERKA